MTFPTYPGALAAILQGIVRPGAWERSWLTQVFGDDWTDELEVDPDAPWRRRKKTAPVEDYGDEGEGVDD